MRPRTIGIIGGMGPYAGLELMRQVFQHTPARSDQEHLPVIHLCMPGDIPDRTAFLLGKVAENPAISITRLILDAERIGAEIFGIPCNTFHSYKIISRVLDELEKAGSRALLLNMVEETIRHLQSCGSKVRRIGVLSTTGTYLSGVYFDALKSEGFVPVIQDRCFQDQVIHRCIYDPQFGLKARSSPVSDQAAKLIQEAMRFFRINGADAVILGCTELSFAMSGISVTELQVIDPLEVLAVALIRESVSGMPREDEHTRHQKIQNV